MWVRKKLFQWLRIEPADGNMLVPKTLHWLWYPSIHTHKSTENTSMPRMEVWIQNVIKNNDHNTLISVSTRHENTEINIPVNAAPECCWTGERETWPLAVFYTSCVVISALKGNIQSSDASGGKRHTLITLSSSRGRMASQWNLTC